MGPCCFCLQVWSNSFICQLNISHPILCQGPIRKHPSTRLHCTAEQIYSNLSSFQTLSCVVELNLICDKIMVDNTIGTVVSQSPRNSNFQTQMYTVWIICDVNVNWYFLMWTIPKESCNGIEFISATQCRLCSRRHWKWGYTQLKAATINHLNVPVTALMFSCTGTQLYNPEFRDEMSLRQQSSFKI